jgi:hypothetical protein
MEGGDANMVGSHDMFLKISNTTVSEREWYLSPMPDKPKFVRKRGKSPCPSFHGTLD